MSVDFTVNPMRRRVEGVLAGMPAPEMIRRFCDCMRQRARQKAFLARKGGCSAFGLNCTGMIPDDVGTTGQAWKRRPLLRDLTRSKLDDKSRAYRSVTGERAPA